MRTSILALVALVGATAAAFAPSANATDYCNGNGQVVSVANAAYVTLDAIASHGFLFSIWVYAESNGESGLQRGGTTLTLGEADSCQDSGNPDTGII